MLKDFNLINKCNIHNCLLLRKHFRNRNINNNNYTNNNEMFYFDLINSMHCHLFHLYDIGKTININKINNDGIQYFDPKSANISQKLKGFNTNRFSNKKFNINNN